MDGLAFFFQFVVAEQDRHRFSFITHRGKEQLNVARYSIEYTIRFARIAHDGPGTCDLTLAPKVYKLLQ